MSAVSSSDTSKCFESFALRGAIIEIVGCPSSILTHEGGPSFDRCHHLDYVFSIADVIVFESVHLLHFSGFPWHERRKKHRLCSSRLWELFHRVDTSIMSLWIDKARGSSFQPLICDAESQAFSSLFQELWEESTRLLTLPRTFGRVGLLTLPRTLQQCSLERLSGRP